MNKNLETANRIVKEWVALPDGGDAEANTMQLVNAIANALDDETERVLDLVRSTLN